MGEEIGEVAYCCSDFCERGVRQPRIHNSVFGGVAFWGREAKPQREVTVLTVSPVD